MQVDVHVSLGQSAKPHGGKSVTRTEKGLAFAAPRPLVDAGFPAAEATFQIPSILAPDAIVEKYAAAAARGIVAERKNHVFIGYGQRYSAKRAQLFDKSRGLAGALLVNVANQLAAASGATFGVICYGAGTGEALVDFVDAANADAVIMESAHESPKPTKLEMKIIRSAADAANVSAAIAKNVEDHFAPVNSPPATPEEEAMPPYVGTTIVFVLHRFDDAEAVAAGGDTSSVLIVALPDSDRPVLCGIDPAQQAAYDEAQRHLGAVCGIVTAINCNRLRVPYGKTKLTSMMKRTYNAEKNQSNSRDLPPTLTVFWAHVLDDEGSAEEAYHTLCTTRRCLSLVGGIAVGNITRDLAVEKWRVEQDILELKDELAIAKAVHDYKPCIYDQPKPIANVAEEVRKRVEAIKRKRLEARQKAEQEVEKRAAEEAEKYIAKLERESGKTMQDLEKNLQDLQDEKTRLEVERNKRREEHEKHLAKIFKKRDEEEALAAKLRTEVEALESELNTKKDLVAKKRAQLDAASEDQAKGRAAILKERDEIRATRAKLYEQRRQERMRWLEEIRAANERLLEQTRQLSIARQEAAKNGVPDTGDSEETEEAIRADIESINEYLPKLISLEDVPADTEAVEAIRRQLEEYFEGELKDYTVKLDDEKKRLAALQAHVETYRSKLDEHQTKQKKELLAEAMKKDNHLQSLVDQVIQYLQHGLRMYKVSSTKEVRYRFFFLTDDCKKICACELDENGMAVNRKKPTATIVLKDVMRITLGTYTPSFVAFAGEHNLRACRDAAMRDDGNASVELTQPIKASNLGKYNYRAFALEMVNGKTLEVVCETDSDCEAWVVALKRLFNYRTDYERRTSRAVRDQTADIRWGAALEVRNRAGAKELSVEETTFCADYHVTPKLYLTTKEAVVAKSQNAFVTVYDVRVASKLDLLRAQQFYEFLIDHRVIPPPRAT
jgi:hypothetical protein